MKIISIFKQINSLQRLNYANKLVFSKRCLTTAKPRNDTIDEPAKFSTSKAKSWDPVDTFIHKNTRSMPKIQPFVVVFSAITMLVYFVFIREENEIDTILSRTLEESVPNVKEMTLRTQIAKYENLGLDTRELKQALAKELEKKGKK
jgi:hypothetical protein